MPKVATKPMTCYKVMLKYNFPGGENRIVSPFQTDREWELNSKFPAQDKQPFHVGSTDNESIYSIETGGFHTFKNLKDAASLKRWFDGGVYDKYREFLVVRCEIPAGAKYYSGNWSIFWMGPEEMISKGDPCYASEKLLVKDIVLEGIRWQG